jgi:hypothetical protein
MGPEKYEHVGKSQSVLMMIHPMRSPGGGGGCYGGQSSRTDHELVEVHSGVVGHDADAGVSRHRVDHLPQSGDELPEHPLAPRRRGDVHDEHERRRLSWARGVGGRRDVPAAPSCRVSSSSSRLTLEPRTPHPHII